VRVFITEAVAAGVFALRSNKTSSVDALITTHENFAKRGSVANVATEQLRALDELGLGEAETVLEADARGALVTFPPNPPMLNPPMIKPKIARPMSAPLPTSLKYLKPWFTGDTRFPLGVQTKLQI
jgi:hypothetical protein